MKTTRIVASILIAAALTAQTQLAVATSHTGTYAQASGAVLVDGEVRKIDKEQGKVTLRHGPISNLDMPAMTMVFKVADAKMLDAVKEGDNVRFAADKVNGTITVTALQVAK